MTEKAQNLAQIEKLVASQTLHGSESLCKLLKYLASHSLEHPSSSPKEYQIATEVFGRQPDFDPHVDSTVRVQAGRLRTKLGEYYSSEGAEDPILVELPKGTYALTFHSRETNGVRGGSVKGTASAAEANVASRPGSGRSPRWFAAVIVVAVLLSAVVAVSTDRLFGRKTAEARLTNTPDAPTPFRVFWKGFLNGPEEPWVIFSNAAFVGRPDIGMRYYNRARDSNALILDHYTGVGEVLAVHALDGVFSQLHQQLRVKRGSLFSLDDAKNNDLIFIGSPSENLTLLEIPSTKEFVFRQVKTGARAGNMEIVNEHPESGEPKEYLATPSTEPLTEDYSVIALVKGLNPTRSELILAGTTTIGTQAAVEYVCQQNSLEELLLRLSVSNSGDLKPFEAVIRVKVARGVPVGTQLVAVHKAGP
jgi:hypothetical protein